MTETPFTPEQIEKIREAVAAIPAGDLAAAQRTVEFVANSAMKVCEHLGDTSIETWTNVLGHIVEKASEADPEIGRKVSTSFLFLALDQAAR